MYPPRPTKPPPDTVECASVQAAFESPLPDSNRRPLPYHEGPEQGPDTAKSCTLADSDRAPESADLRTCGEPSTHPVPGGDLPTLRHAITTTRCACTKCAYCDGYLSPRHEHDHFPIPKSLGGTEVIPVCLSCHDLKDRVPLEDWPIEALWAGVQGMLTGPPRLLVAAVLAKLMRQERATHPAVEVLADMLALKDELKVGLDRERQTGALYSVADWADRMTAVEDRARLITEHVPSPPPS